MHKKSMYWLLGILVVLLLLWLAMRDGGSGADGQMQESGAVEQQLQHPPVGTPEEHANGYMGEQDAAMDEMMRAMEAVTPTGNAALDYLDGMLPHHVAAISMAESYLKHGGQDEALRQIAQDVIIAQRAEIDEMQRLAQTLRDKNEKDAAQETAYIDEYKAMLAQHHASHTMPPTTDEAFAAGMILHHQMAVDMSEAILRHTSEEGVRKLAQSIVDAQVREIAQMQDALRKLQQS